MRKIAVLTDSGSGISVEQGKELGIFVLPLQVIIDNKAYDDGITMSNAQLIQELRNKKVPKTSTPTFASILTIFEQIKEAGFQEALIDAPRDFYPNTPVKFMIIAKTPMGYKAIVDDKYEGRPWGQGMERETPRVDSKLCLDWLTRG